MEYAEYIKMKEKEEQQTWRAYENAEEFRLTAKADMAQGLATKEMYSPIAHNAAVMAGMHKRVVNQIMLAHKRRLDRLFEREEIEI